MVPQSGSLRVGADTSHSAAYDEVLPAVDGVEGDPVPLLETPTPPNDAARPDDTDVGR